jgi:hypothetical protein
MSAAPTIPVSTIGKAVLIRVFNHGYSAPKWYILGTQSEYEFEYYWGYGKDLVLGEQSAGEHILDVTDLGLDPIHCLAYLEARDRMEALCEEEYMFNLHSDPNGKCFCGPIAEQRAISDAIGEVITSAVLERFDAWTRRRHFLLCGHPMIEEELPTQAAAEPEAPVATHPSTDRPPWADAATTIGGYY